MEIRILGPLEVLVDGEPATPGSSRERTLLAVLALAVGQAVSTDRLAEALWGEELPANPTNALQAVVSRLRRSVGSESVVTRTPGYALEIDPEAIDAVRFRRMVRTAQSISDAAQRSALLQTALDQWRGEALADFPFEEFGQQERSSLEEMRLLAIDLRIGADLERGLAAELIPELEELITQHPFRESLRRHQMLALYRAGRQAEALRAYAAARRTLGDELGIEPGPELQELENAILLQDPDLRPVGHADQGPRGPRLPGRIASFIGRSREIREVQEALQTSRLVTLTGAGGTGKTSLAVEVGRHLDAEYDGEVWLIELAPVTDPARVGDAWISALGLDEVAPLAARQRSADPMASIVEYLRHRRALLIVDNCEHVIAAASRISEAVLLACPDVDILTTSRDRLGVPGELLWRIPSLSTDRDDSQADAIRLFIERAATVLPGFAPTPDETMTIREICRRLDGMPLAIELAAARIRSLPVDEIAVRLESGIGILGVSRSKATHRQQTLEAAIDWSFRLLSPEEQDLFVRLSVFHGSFTLDAAMTVSDGPTEQLDEFERLLDSSMVSSLSSGAERRFRMLETIRMYAADKLRQSDSEHRTMSRLLDYFLTRLADVEDGLRGPEQMTILDRVEADLDTIRAVLDWGEVNSPARALRLAGMLGWFWFLKGNTAEARDRYNSLLGIATDDAEPRALGDALFFRCLHDSTPHLSRDDFARSLEAYREAEYQRGVANAQAMLGSWGFDVAESSELMARAAEICVEEDYQWGLALIRFLQAGGAMVAGDNRASVEKSLEAANRFAALGDRWGQGYAWYQAGTALRALGEYDKAVEAFEAALRNARPMRLRREMAPVISELASIATMQGDYARAASLLEEARAYADEVPFAGSRGMVRNAQGKLARLQGDYAEAIRLHRRAIDLYDDEAGIGGKAYAYSSLALAEEMSGDLEAAQRHHRKGLALARQSGDPYAIAFSLEGLGTVAVAAGDGERGVALISAGLALRERSGTPLPDGERFDVDRAIGKARLDLGEERYEAALAAGEGLDPDSVESQ